MPVRERGTAIAISVALAAIGLAGCTANGVSTPVAVSTTFDGDVLTPEQNAGDRSELHSVQAAAVAALTDENRAFVVSPTLRRRSRAEVLAAVLAASPTRERAALLGRARTSALASDLQRSFTSYARREFGAASGGSDSFLDHDVWASSTFHVDRWQGVQIAGDTARVLVRGEDRGTSWAGTDRRDAWAQYQLILRRDATALHGWRLVLQKAASTAA